MNGASGNDPSALRSRVSAALVSTLAISGDTTSNLTPGAAIVAALAGRAEMVLSPLVARVTQVPSTNIGLVTAFGHEVVHEVVLEVLLHDEGHLGEAIERLVAMGYGFVGDCGVAGREILIGPTDEPIHDLHIVSA